MRQLTFNIPNEKLQIDVIENLEKELNIKLPREYCSFLLVNNNSYPSERYFIKEGESFLLQCFYSITSDQSRSLQFYISLFHRKVMSAHFVPFGHDPGGWPYVVSIREIDYGNIYHYRIGDEEEDECLVFLSNSFEKFIDELKTESEIHNILE